MPLLVLHRPNSQPWTDVSQIVRWRDRYIDLVVKRLLNPEIGSGFRGGLSNLEGAELLVVEDLLPIEALQAFHLLALRTVYYIQRYFPTELGTVILQKQSWKPIER